MASTCLCLLFLIEITIKTGNWYFLVCRSLNVVHYCLYVDVYNQLDDFQPFFPTVEDLRGSISAIYLLQDTYNITADDMASGNIPG